MNHNLVGNISVFTLMSVMRMVRIFSGVRLPLTEKGTCYGVPALCSIYAADPTLNIPSDMISSKWIRSNI